jgi:hypothetical protein
MLPPIRHAGFWKTILTCLLFYPGLNNAQDFYDDSRFWLYFKFDKDISKVFNAQLIIQNRFNNNVTEFSQWNINPELNVKLTKYFKLIGGYVYGTKLWPEGYYGTRQQVYGGFQARYRLRRFSLYYRNLVQGQTKASQNYVKANIFYYYDRNKLTLKYELNKRFEFYLAEEFNIPFYRTTEYDLYLNRNRLFGGAQFNLSRKTYLELYAIFQSKFSYKTEIRDRAWIFGLTYSHTF